MPGLLSLGHSLQVGLPPGAVGLESYGLEFQKAQARAWPPETQPRGEVKLLYNHNSYPYTRSVPGISYRVKMGGLTTPF